MGTGRAMRAAVEQVPAMDCPDHQLVSLVGNISPDGSASFFDTVARLADLTKARHYPMPLPVFVSSEAEREQLLQSTRSAGFAPSPRKAELRLVGVGQIDQGAQLFVDGFISREELLELMRLGRSASSSVGVRRARTHHRGRQQSTPDQRPASTGCRRPRRRRARAGQGHGHPSRLGGALLSGLITDEATAKALLQAR